MRAIQGESKIDYTKCLVFDGVTADCDPVPNNWTSRAPGDVINLERLFRGKGPRGVVKATAHTATTCTRG